MDLTTQLGRVLVDGVIGNSPGPRKSLVSTEDLFLATCPVVTLGSITPRRRMGNAEPRTYADDKGLFTQNYVGLANSGIEEVLVGLPSLLEKAQESGKHLVVSLAGNTIEDLVGMVKQLSEFDLTVELNLTCPNVESGLGHAIIWAFDLGLVDETITEVRRIYQDNLVVKLNYHPDQDYVAKMVKILVDGRVDAVALINTLPMSLIINQSTLRPEMSGNLGFGGLSGRSILPIGLGVVLEYSRQLPEGITVIGEGGITSGFDILTYFVAGADFCRSASVYDRKGPQAFSHLTMEFVEEMEKRGFESLADIPRLDPL